jgi:tetratricopeptide (TPR) repeat protein
MLTTDGRVLLLDFGLAAAEGSARITAAGGHVGSLAYMSPEQVRGEHGALDRRSDVYSLGVTLLELLALQPAFAAQSVESLRDDILRGEVAPLRALNRSVPRDAETVCRTAMELQPERRYESAAALAADLGAVLDRRPIAARRTPALLQARRWTQRHPAAAVFFAMGLLLVVGGPVGYAVQQRKARLAVEEQRRIAEANLAAALDAVDQMLTRVGDETLADVPQMEGVRRTLLEDALRFYGGFLAQYGETPELRRLAGRAHDRVGRLRALLAEPAAAEASYRESMRLLDGLAAEQPGDLDALALAALARTDLGEMLASIPARQGDAEVLLEEAARSFESLPTEGEGHEEAVTMLGTCEHNRALIESQTGRLPEARARFERVLELQRAQVGRLASAEATAARNSLATSLAQSGDVLAALGEKEAALDRQREAVSILDQLVAAEPAAADLRLRLALAHGHLGALRFGGDDVEGARGDVNIGLQLVDGLVRDFPTVSKYRLEQASMYNALAVLAGFSGSLAEAEDAFTRAVATLEEVERQHPDTEGLTMALAMARINHADCLVSQQRWEDAERTLLAEIALRRRLYSENPQHPVVPRLIDLEVYNLELLLPHWTDAARLAEIAAEFPRQAPGDPQWCHRPAKMLLRSAELAAAAGDDAAAGRYRQQALDLLQEAVRRGWRDSASLRNDAAWGPVREDARFGALLDAMSAE